MVRWIVSKLRENVVRAKDGRDWLKANFSWEAKLTPLLGYLGAEIE